MVVGGLFWAIFSGIYGVIGGLSGEVPIQGRFLVSLFGVMFFLSLPGTAVIELVNWFGRRGEKRDTARAEAETSISLDRRCCTHCGSKMASDGIFCPSCGRKQP